MNLVDRVIARLSRRPPDFVIGDPSAPYLRRWWLVPRNRFLNVYLHQFLHDDEDRALHDHRMMNASVPLTIGYYEVQFAYRPRAGEPLPPTASPVKHRRPGRVYPRLPSTAHRVVLARDADGRPLSCWSLFIGGPHVREWGFWCPHGRWVGWRDFTAGEHGEIVGKGCGE